MLAFKKFSRFSTNRLLRLDKFKKSRCGLILTARNIAIFLQVICLIGTIGFIYNYQLPPPVQTQDITTVTRVDAAPSFQSGYPNVTDAQKLSWTSVELPNNWHRIWPNHQGTVWYKIDLPRDANQLQNQGIQTAYVNQAAVVFVNGIEIARTTPVWPPINSTWYTPFLWEIPDGILSAGNNQILIAVYSEALGRVGLPRLQIGKAKLLQSAQAKQALLQQFMTFSSLIVTLLLSIFFVFLWVVLGKNSAAYWQGILTFSSGIIQCEIQYNISEIIHTLIPALNGQKLLITGALVAGPAFVLTVIRFYNLSFPKYEKILAVYFAVCSICLYAFSGKALYLLIVFITCSTVLLLCTASITAQYWGWRKDSSRVNKFFALTCFGFGSISILDAAVYLDLIPTHIFFEVISGNIINTIALVFHSWRFAQVTFQSKQQKETLDQKLQEVKQEIESSLKQQQQLEISQIKQNEYHQFWRDLHDGFSSSLLGTLLFLEQKKLSIQQTIELLNNIQEELKLSVQVGTLQTQNLADILKYVHDTMFERLSHVNILLIWNTPPSIPVSGSVAQQLPLIIREALVNALKHSRASQVNCDFKLNNTHYLQVEISDNGDSFVDIPSAQPTSTGLGLQSMKMRVEFLQGKWHWNRDKNGTTLRFEIPIKSLASGEDSSNMIFLNRHKADYVS